MENISNIKINSKLLEFQRKIGIIKKDGKNPHFKSTYATLSQILSDVKPVLSELGLVLLQLINDKGIGSVIIDAENGEEISSYIPMPQNLNAQQLGSAITYYRRYTLASLLSLEIDDDDANTASQPQVKKEIVKPKCGSKAFDQAIEKLKGGDKSIIQKMIETFDLTTEQNEILQDYK